MNKEKKTQPKEWRTSKAERINYIVGEIGRTCEGSIVTAFMTLFLVFQGIDLKLVAGVMLAVKIIDAFDDVIFGYLIDRLHITKVEALKKITGDGKYIPWFRLTFAFFPLFTIIFFLMPTGIPMTGKLIWFAVFYILYDFGYTLVEVPMNSLLVTLSDNIDERNHIIQYKTIVGGLAVILVQVIWMALISEYVGIPLRLVALFSSIIFFFLMLPLATKVKEHNTVLSTED
jgi:Na+/melibiose symporter-like transporter